MYLVYVWCGVELCVVCVGSVWCGVVKCGVLRGVVGCVV